MSILIREHYCWCDSTFCGCKHEVYDMEKKIKYKATVGSLHQIEKIWSTFSPSSAHYMKKDGEEDKEWDPEVEIQIRSLNKE